MAVCLEVCYSGHLHNLLSLVRSELCFHVVLKVSLLSSFQLLDFPPILWVFDAHSLWHLSTVPLPLLWYRLVGKHLLSFELNVTKLSTAFLLTMQSSKYKLNFENKCSAIILNF